MHLTPVRPSPVPLTSVLLAAVGLAACGSEAGSAGAVVVTDSAGVRIVVNPDASFDDAGEPWLVGDTPSVVIGDVAGDEAVLFDRVMGIDRLGDGRWVVADMGSSQVRWYDPGGTPLLSAGGRGEGPQEFRQVMGMRRLQGDTLVIDDARTRLHIMHDGAFLGFLEGDSPVGERTELTGVLGDGTPVAITLPAFPQRISEPQTLARSFHRATLLREGERGFRLQVRDTIGTWDETRYVPGWNESTTAIRFDGRRLFALQGDGLVVADPMKFEFQFVSPDGELRTVARAEWTPRPITEADIARERDAYINQGGEGGSEVSPQLLRQRTDIADSWRFADHMPGFSELMVDRLDHVWVREYVPSEPTVGLWVRAPVDPVRWLIFAPDGALVARVETPARFRPSVIGEDFIAGLYYDAFEVEHVHSYPLRRR
jgi:hypothetical protein